MASTDFHASVAAGRQLFEAGRFHAAHEAWEMGWRRTHHDERHVLQALVLWSAALCQHERGKDLGAHRLLLRALERLAEVSDGFDGLDVDALREALVTSLEHTKAPWCEAARPAWFDATELHPPSLELEKRLLCAYCGEPVLVMVAPEDADGAQYVEDCPVCCRPWQVTVRRDGDDVRVLLERDDAQDEARE